MTAGVFDFYQWEWKHQDTHGVGRKLNSLGEVRKLGDRVLADYGIDPKTVTFKLEGWDGDTHYGFETGHATVRLGWNVNHAWGLLHEIAHVVLFHRRDPDHQPGIGTGFDGHHQALADLLVEMLTRYTRVRIDSGSLAALTATSTSGAGRTTIPWPDLVRTWEQTRPWAASREAVERGEVKGFAVGDARGSEAASFEDRWIILKADYWTYPPESRRSVIYHEAGHALGAALGLRAVEPLYARIGVDPWSPPGNTSGLFHGGDPVAILADGYAAVWEDGGAWLDRHDLGWLKTLTALAAKQAGFPLPDGVRVGKVAGLADVLRRPWYHGSDLRGGIDLLRKVLPSGKGQRRYGDGLYLTSDKDEALRFGRYAVEVRLNTTSAETLPPRGYDDDPDIPEGTYDVLYIPPNWAVARNPDAVEIVAVHPRPGLEVPKVAAKPRSLADLTRAEFESKRWLYHGTRNASDLETLLTQGVRMSNVPMNLNRQRWLSGDLEGIFFQPGTGVGMGLYVSGDYYEAQMFGNHIVAIEWLPSDEVVIPPEHANDPGYKFEWGLKGADGVLITSDIPSERVYLVKRDSKRYDYDPWGAAQAQKTGSKLAAVSLPSGYVMEKHEKTAHGEPYLTIIVKHQGQPIGALGVYLSKDKRPRHDGSMIYVDAIQVYEEHQRKGIATAMWEVVHQHWPDVPVMHSWGPAQSPSARALNQTLKEKYGPHMHLGAAIPRPPGETPIPAGTVRAYHYTSEKNADAIRRDGLRLDRAQGASYGEGRGVWFSTNVKDWGNPDSLQGKVLVEVALPQDTTILNGGFGGTFVIGEDVPLSRIVAIHEGWHARYRYFVEEDMVAAVKAGEYDDLADMGDYGKAIEHIKRQGAIDQKVTVWRGVGFYVPREDARKVMKLDAAGMLDVLLGRRYGHDFTQRRVYIDGLGIGRWWSTSREIGEKYAGRGVINGYGDFEIGVLLRGEAPSDAQDPTTPVESHGYTSDVPVIMRPGTPVTITGIWATTPATPTTKRFSEFGLRDLGLIRRQVTALGRKLWRHMRLTLPLDRVLAGDVADAALEQAKEGPERSWARPDPKAGLGVHWTDDEHTAKTFEHPEAFVSTRWSEGRGPAVVTLPVVLEGRTSPGHIRSDPGVVDEYAMVQYDLRYDLPITESEVPVARGAPVLVEAVHVWLPSRASLQELAERVATSGYGGKLEVGQWERHPVNLTMAATKDTWKQIEGLEWEVGPGNSLRAYTPESRAKKMAAGVIVWRSDGEIHAIKVIPAYRRMGLATELLRRAREIDPNVHHSKTLTEDGRAWSEVAASKTAAAIPLSIQQLADQFAPRVPNWADPMDANGMCIQAEAMFREFVRSHPGVGYKSWYVVGALAMSESQEEVWAYYGDRPQNITHNAPCVTLDGGKSWWVIDFTYRQFDEASPFPVIEPEDVYLRRWSEHRVFNQRMAASVSDDPGRWERNTQRWREAQYPFDNQVAVKPVGRYVLHLTASDEEGYRYIFATWGDRVVGNVFFGPQLSSPGEGIEAAIEVDPEHRRRGVGTAMYVWAEEVSGKKLIPSPGHSTDAEAFWSQPNRAFGAKPPWLINGKPYHDGVWIEVESDTWYRGADHQAREIPSRMIVVRQGDGWAWEAMALTFIGAPHENRAGAQGPRRGTAKTLEEAQARAEGSLTKDHEFFRRYDDRMRAKLQTEAALAWTIEAKPFTDPFMEEDKEKGIVRLSDDGVTYSARLDGEIIGYLRLRKRLTDGVWEVYRVKVYEDHQRKGVARSLIERARADLGRVDHAPEEERTMAGEAWSQAVGRAGRTAMPWTEGPADSDRCTETVLNQFGIFGKRPRNGNGVIDALVKAGWGLRVVDDGGEPFRGTVAEFYERFKEGSYYIVSEGHAMAMVDGLLVDSAGKGPDDRPLIAAFEVFRPKTAGPAGGVLPERVKERGPIDPSAPRRVVLDPMALRDFNQVLHPDERNEAREALEDLAAGRAKLEPKRRELEGVWGIRVDEDCRLLVYPHVDGAWHAFYIGRHDYDEAARRWGHPLSRAASMPPGRYYHLADKVNFKLDPKYRPINNTTWGGDWEPSIFIAKSVEPWVNGYGYWRPWVVEFEVPSNIADLAVFDKGYGGELLVPAEHYDKLRITRVLPLDGWCREEYGEWGWTEADLDTDYDTGEPINSNTYGTWRGYVAPDARTWPKAKQQEYAKRVRAFRRGRLSIKVA